MQYPDRDGWPALEQRKERVTHLPRGLLKYALLYLLDEREAHGYELLHRLRERKWGAPGPGSVYPLLATLEQDGLATGRDDDSRRVYTITEKGQKILADHARNLRSLMDVTKHDTTHDAGEDTEPNERLREAAARLMQAASHSTDLPKPETRARICDILERARKDIYNVLAEE